MCQFTRHAVLSTPVKRISSFNTCSGIIDYLVAAHLSGDRLPPLLSCGRYVHTMLVRQFWPQTNKGHNRNKNINMQWLLYHYICAGLFLRRNNFRCTTSEVQRRMRFPFICIGYKTYNPFRKLSCVYDSS